MSKSMWQELSAPGVVYARAPRLVLPQRVWQKLCCLARAVVTEIGGYGTCRLHGGDVIVTDVFTVPQHVTTGEVVLTDVGTAQLVDLIKARGESPATLRMQWHSHVDGNVFWSGQDRRNIKDNLLSLSPWFVSLEVNHRGDCLCRLDIRTPMRIEIGLQPVILLEPLSVEEQQACLAAITRDVKEVVPNTWWEELLGQAEKEQSPHVNEVLGPVLVNVENIGDPNSYKGKEVSDEP